MQREILARLAICDADVQAMIWSNRRVYCELMRAPPSCKPRATRQASRREGEGGGRVERWRRTLCLLAASPGFRLSYVFSSSKNAAWL